MTLHEELEAALAAFKHVEAVLTFQSGFTCNTGVIPVVAGEPDLIVSDQLNHASIIDGMRLAKAPRVIYRHKDVAHLRELLAAARRDGRPDGQPYRAILVVTDGVFSMDGDIAPLPAIVGGGRGARRGRLRRRRPRLGRPGPQRPRARVDHFDLHGRVAIQVGTLSKAIGVLGGYVAGPARAARDADPARPAVPLLHLAPAGRRGRLPGRDPGPRGGARAHRAALGEHPPLQGGAPLARLRHRRLRDADHAGHGRRLGAGDPLRRPAPRRGRLGHVGRLPDRRPRRRPAADDRDRGPHRRRARRLPRPPSPASAGSWGSSPGDARRGEAPATARPRHGRPRRRRDRASIATCRSTPTSTRTSRPTATSRSTSTARPRSSAGIPEIAITDHLDFDPRAPGLRLRRLRRRASGRSARPRSGGPTAGSPSASASRSATSRTARPRSASTWPRHPYDFVIGSRPRHARTRRTRRPGGRLGRRASRSPRSWRRTSTRSWPRSGAASSTRWATWTTSRGTSRSTFRPPPSPRRRRSTSPSCGPSWRPAPASR